MREKTRQQIVAMADDQYGEEGRIEIDDNAEVHVSDDDGCYVQAWVWIALTENQPLIKKIRREEKTVQPAADLRSELTEACKDAYEYLLEVRQGEEEDATWKPRSGHGWFVVRRLRDVIRRAKKAEDKALIIIRDLLEWAGHTGGWEAKCWRRAEKYSLDASKNRTPGE